METRRSLTLQELRTIIRSLAARTETDEQAVLVSVATELLLDVVTGFLPNSNRVVTLRERIFNLLPVLAQQNQ